jgi:hypothetical protein
MIMNTRTIIFLLVTVAIVSVAWKLTQEKAPITEITATHLYPELLDRVNLAQRITVKSAAHEVVLANPDGAWVVENRANFAAESSKVKRLLLELAALKVVESKTSKPERYARIGVEGLAAEKSQSTVVTVQSDDTVPLVELIVGNRRAGRALGDESHFMRKVGAAGALLVGGDFDVNADPLDWLDASVVNIPTQRVRQVTIDRPPEQPIMVSKASPKENFFELRNIPDGYEPKSRATISSLGGILLDVKFRDVATSSAVANMVPRTIVTVETFDGLAATIEQFDVEEKVLLRFAFNYNADDVYQAPVEEAVEADAAAEDAANAEEAPEASVADEVTELNTKVAGWLYELPDYKIRIIDKDMESLIKVIEPDDEKEQAAAADEVPADS